MSSTNGDFAGSAPSDPLIPSNYNEWMLNSYWVIKRSGTKILAVLALWSIIPTLGAVATSAISWPAFERFNEQLPTGQNATMSQAESDAMLTALGQLAGYSGIGIVISAILAYFSSAAWASALRIAITDAAAKPVTIQQAMAYGACRGLAMWGWYTLVTVVVLVGLCLCVFPGLYLIVVLALFAPIVVCEGGPAMARSLRLVHNAFGKALGRIAISLGVVFVAGMVIFTVQSLVAEAGLGTGFGSPNVLDFVVDGLFSLLSTLITSVILVSALLVTYAEARAAEGGPSSSTQLLEQSPG